MRVSIILLHLLLLKAAVSLQQESFSKLAVRASSQQQVAASQTSTSNESLTSVSGESGRSTVTGPARSTAAGPARSTATGMAAAEHATAGKAHSGANTGSGNQAGRHRGGASRRASSRRASGAAKDTETMVSAVSMPGDSASWVLLIVGLVAIPVLAAFLVFSAMHDDTPTEKESTFRMRPHRSVDRGDRGAREREREEQQRRPSRQPLQQRNVPPERAPFVATRGAASVEVSPTPSLPPQGLRSLQSLHPSLAPVHVGPEAPLCPDLLAADRNGLLIGVPVDLTNRPEIMVIDVRNVETDALVARAFVSEPMEQGIMLLTGDGSPAAFLETASALADPLQQQANRYAVLRRALSSSWDGGAGPQTPYAVLFLNRGANGSTLVARQGDGRSRGAPLLSARVGADGKVAAIVDESGRPIAVQESAMHFTPSNCLAGSPAGSRPAARSVYRVMHGQDAGLVLCVVFAAQKLA